MSVQLIISYCFTIFGLATSAFVLAQTNPRNLASSAARSGEPLANIAPAAR
jgi:hypothetical protein